MSGNVLHNEMRVVPLHIMKDDGDHARILSHHVISGVQIVVVSGNVFGLFYEFSTCPVEALGLFSFSQFILRFGRRIRVGTFLYLSFKLHVLQYGPM